jgi:hypothetical protein
MNRLRLTVAAIAAAALAIVLSSCAPLPPAGLSLFGCQADQPCVIVQVKNDNFYQAAVFANRRRLGEVNGDGHATLSVPVSALEPPGCAVFGVRLIDGNHETLTTSKECIQPGQRFELWITPKISGTNVAPRE